MLVQLGLVAWGVTGTSLAEGEIGKHKYIYDSLVGHGLWPSDARDQYGDIAGGWGSGIAADVSTWKMALTAESFTPSLIVDGIRTVSFCSDFAEG